MCPRFTLACKKTARGTSARPLANPWAGYLTEILSYEVVFEKFSWCFKSEDLRINKRRLARLPHESALTYVVGFSV